MFFSPSSALGFFLVAGVQPSVLPEISSSDVTDTERRISQWLR